MDMDVRLGTAGLSRRNIYAVVFGHPRNRSLDESLIDWYVVSGH
jgi:hypothetical protein